MSPIVSVCMITYNHERFIAQAIEGVLMQKTEFPIELIIGDDFSTDRTREICIDYQKKFPEIIKLRLPPKNLGVMPNFIQNLQACKGKYIGICEGDDFWTDPFKLQKQVDFLEANPDFSLCFTDATVVNEFGVCIGKKLTSRYKRNLTQTDILSSTTPPTLTVLFREKVFSSMIPKDLKLVLNGDTFLFSLLTYNGDAAYMDYCSAAYRVHNGGVWSMIDKEKKLRNSIRTFTHYLESSPVKNKKALIRNINSLYRDYVNLSIENKNNKLKMELLRQCTVFNLKYKNFYFLTLLKVIFRNV
ncbi:glycosyltransferase [Pontibacter qinzhouensis]|uniref:glycosyltransferase n=1 Tax=Pontibacter qinzhouensis TaxID=2603253 RepID=UPI001C9BEDCC|nr:glycosyltransferase [Pontibacter qinzhouensis]